MTSSEVDTRAQPVPVRMQTGVILRACVHVDGVRVRVV